MHRWLSAIRRSKTEKEDAHLQHLSRTLNKLNRFHKLSPKKKKALLDLLIEKHSQYFLNTPAMQAAHLSFREKLWISSLIDLRNEINHRISNQQYAVLLESSNIGERGLTLSYHTLNSGIVPRIFTRNDKKQTVLVFDIELEDGLTVRSDPLNQVLLVDVEQIKIWWEVTFKTYLKDASVRVAMNYYKHLPKLDAEFGKDNRPQMIQGHYYEMLLEGAYERLRYFNHYQATPQTDDELLNQLNAVEQLARLAHGNPLLGYIELRRLSSIYLPTDEGLLASRIRELLGPIEDFKFPYEEIEELNALIQTKSLEALQRIYYQTEITDHNTRHQRVRMAWMSMMWLMFLMVPFAWAGDPTTQASVMQPYGVGIALILLAGVAVKRFLQRQSSTRAILPSTTPSESKTLFRFLNFYNTRRLAAFNPSEFQLIHDFATNQPGTTLTQSIRDLTSLSPTEALSLLIQSRVAIRFKSNPDYITHFKELHDDLDIYLAGFKQKLNLPETFFINRGASNSFTIRNQILDEVTPLLSELTTTTIYYRGEKITLEGFPMTTTMILNHLIGMDPPVDLNNIEIQLLMAGQLIPLSSTQWAGSTDTLMVQVKTNPLPLPSDFRRILQKLILQSVIRFTDLEGLSLKEISRLLQTAAELYLTTPPRNRATSQSA